VPAGLGFEAEMAIRRGDEAEACSTRSLKLSRRQADLKAAKRLLTSPS
jgi:hypothetical protein